MSRAAALRAAGCYALLVAAVWGPFTLGSGMPHETVFPYLSETQSVIGGFFFDDFLRILMTVFFQVAYLLGEVAGIGGSFVPYQIVYALLWWARGLLCFLILRRVLPGWPVFHLAAGGLVILHGADTTANWVGAMNQQGMLVWTLAAGYALVRALQAGSERERRWASGAAAGLLVLSLWSYESQIALVCTLPLLLASTAPGPRVRRFRSLAPWFVVVLVYLLLTARRYLWIRAASYQASLLRSDASPTALLGDLVFQLRACFEFWRWGEFLPEHAGAALLAGLATLAFSAGLALELRLRRDATETLPGLASSIRWLALGFALAMLSFPAFLLLRDGGTLWRTQILASLGAGLALAAAAAALAALLPRRRPRELLFLLGVCGVAWFGAQAALRAGAWERELWERHRSVMAGLLQLVPDVVSPTRIVLMGVPADADPFLGDNQWFETALRLAYPGRAVFGLYQRDDGTPAPGAPALDRVDAGFAIVIQQGPRGLRLQSTAPQDASIQPERWQAYAPMARILPGPASPRALRRYGRPP